VLQLPGVEGALILCPDVEAPERLRRTVHYRLRDASVLEAIRADHADWPEAGGAQAPASAAVELLLPGEDFVGGAVSTENCRNCGEVLTGQHCAHCGQRARVPVLSLFSLLRDLAGDLLNWDARIWRTLRPLVFRPGFLTLEYLQGRRASYTPPLRMYLVLSLLFFLAVSWGGEPGNLLNINANEQASPEVVDGAPAAEACSSEKMKIEAILPAWEERLREACRRIVSDTGGFTEALQANVPGMMFATLPLLAALMQLLYLGSGRYYVEHLLFFVHFHAFFFLAALLLALLSDLSESLGGDGVGPLVESIGDGLFIAQSIYLPYYLYRAMRRVYGQSRRRTLFKQSLLGVG
ncbi:MAG: DUF3667 domain-containing protein, partial [Gammaproteobacteria bacterium]